MTNLTPTFNQKWLIYMVGFTPTVFTSSPIKDFKKFSKHNSVFRDFLVIGPKSKFHSFPVTSGSIPVFETKGQNLVNTVTLVRLST